MTVAKKGKTTSKARMRASDIKDVEEGLAAVNTDRTLLGAAVSEQTDAQLFFVDQCGATSGSAEARRMREADLPLFKRPLRLDEILRPKSATAPITNNSRAQPAVGAGEAAAIDARVKALLRAAPKPPAVKKEERPADDIWAEGAAAPRRAHARAAPATRVAAVCVPSAGASYRPVEGERDSLMAVAANVEIKRIEEEAAIAATIAPLMLTSASMQRIDSRLEMLLETAALSPAEGGQEVDETPFFHGAAVAKKDETTRKRQERHRALLVDQKRQKMSRLFLASIEKAPEVRKQVAREAAAREAAAAIAAALPTSHLALLNRLGAKPFKVPLIEVQLPDDACDSLRRLIPEGNLVMDRFKSLQERALIEPLAPLAEEAAAAAKVRRLSSRRATKQRSFRVAH